MTLTPGTLLAHRLGAAGPHPERWTARVVVVVGGEVLLAWEWGPRWFSFVAVGVVRRGWCEVEG